MRHYRVNWPPPTATGTVCLQQEYDDFSLNLDKTGLSTLRRHILDYGPTYATQAVMGRPNKLKWINTFRDEYG